MICFFPIRINGNGFCQDARLWGTTGFQELKSVSEDEIGEPQNKVTTGATGKPEESLDRHREG